MQEAIESEHPIQKTIDMAYEQFEARKRCSGKAR